MSGNMALYNLIKVTSDELANVNHELMMMNKELNKVNHDLAWEIEERKLAEEQLNKANNALVDTLEELRITQDRWRLYNIKKGCRLFYQNKRHPFLRNQKVDHFLSFKSFIILQ